MTASTIRPVAPLRLSCLINQIKNATSGNKKTEKKIIEGALILVIELVNEWISELVNALIFSVIELLNEWISDCIQKSQFYNNRAKIDFWI